MINRKVKPRISIREAKVVCVLLSTPELIDLLAFPEKLSKSGIEENVMVKAIHASLIKRFEHYQAQFGKSFYGS